MGRNMSINEINDEDEFRLKIKRWSIIAGCGYYLIFILFPAFVATAFISQSDIDFIIISSYMGLLFGFFLMTALWHKRIMRMRFDFWYDVDVFDQMANVFYFLILGAISSIILLWIVDIRLFGPIGLSSHSQFLIGLVIFGSALPLFYVLSLYREKKLRGLRARTIRVKKEVIDGIVKQAFDTLNLQYEEVIEGSKWTVMLPLYKIRGYGISVWVRNAGLNIVMVGIQTQIGEDSSKAREIEGAIDTFLNGLKGSVV